MNKENKQKLDDLIYDLLVMAGNNADGSKESEVFLKEALDAIDRSMEIEKMERAREEEKMKRIWDRTIKISEIAATAFLVPMMTYVYNMKFAKVICEFEKDYSFTTTAGRTFGSLFRKK